MKTRLRARGRALSMPALLAAALAVMLAASCADDSDNPAPPAANNGSGQNDDGTRLVFDNSRGICDAVVYDDYRRRDGDILTAVPAGASSPELPYHAAPDGETFYFSYQFTARGLENVPLVWTPPANKNQTHLRVDAGKTTTAPVPPLDEALDSLDQRLSAKSYLLVKNDSSYSVALLRGSAYVTPEGAASHTVNPRETPCYVLDSAAASAFTLSCNARPVPFPAAVTTFEAGCVYQFLFNGTALSLQSAATLVLEHLALKTAGLTDNANGPCLFSAWKDSGGENRVSFGRNKALLSGPFWAAFNGKTLVSEYRPATGTSPSSMVVWTNKADSKGILFTLSGDTHTLTNTNDGATRSFLRE